MGGGVCWGGEEGGLGPTTIVASGRVSSEMRSSCFKKDGEKAKKAWGFWETMKFSGKSEEKQKKKKKRRSHPPRSEGGRRTTRRTSSRPIGNEVPGTAGKTEKEKKKPLPVTSGEEARGKGLYSTKRELQLARGSGNICKSSRKSKLSCPSERFGRQGGDRA